MQQDPDSLESSEYLASELKKVRAERDQLKNKVDQLMNAHNLEFISPEDLGVQSLEKRLMAFVTHIASQSEDADLNQILVDEIRKAFICDRVVLMVAGSEDENGYVVTHQSNGRNIFGLELPYYNSLTENASSYNQFLASVNSQEGVMTKQWSKPQNLYENHSVIRVCARKVFNPNTGVLIVVMQWVNPGTTISQLDQSLFGEMMGFANLVVGQSQLVQNLSELEEQYASIVESMPSALVGVDFLGNVTLWNRKAELFFEKPAEEVFGLNLGECVPLLKPICAKLMDAFASESEMVFSPIKTLNSQGQEMHLQPHLFSMMISERGELGIRIDDVSESVRMQRQLLYNVKTEVFGQISWGMANNFSKIVGSIIGTSSLMKKRWEKSLVAPRDLDDLNDIEGLAHRATNLVSRLLDLTQKKTEVMDIVDLVSLVRSAVELAENSFDSRIEFLTEIPYKNIQMRAVANRFETTLLHLMMNARDALASSGFIKVKLSVFSEKEDYAILSVIDNGSGMSREILDKASMPLYTTKERGQGLGLAFVEQTLYNMGGSLHLKSVYGEGTQVDLKIPIVNYQIIDKPQESTESKSAIIVEDDEAIRHLVEKILQEMGIPYSSASDGLEATKLIHKHRSSSVVILDLDMPGLSGPDTYRLIRQLNPQQRFLLTSLEPSRPIFQEMITRNQVHLLGKPFSVESFEAEIEKLLED